ncbi:MAG TPA: four helix bundle protein [bacterium]|nr:four helix bundle protein [bacterium]
MIFDHEKLDVYNLSLEFVGWVFERVSKLRGVNRFARDEVLRASQSIPRNVAEGNGKRSINDRKRYLEIARGSALECAAILDELVLMNALGTEECDEGKKYLKRIVRMLTK